MQLTAFALLAGAIASVSATPAAAQTGVKKFSLAALRAGTPVHTGILSATKNKLYVSLPKDKQDAQCSDKLAHDSATLYVQDGELFLYGGEGKDKQQFVVDQSGMGQGNLQYFSTAAGTPGAPFETKGWAVDPTTEFLTFKRSNLIGCPVADGSYVVYVYSGNDHPANHEGCVVFQAKTNFVPKPVACEYSNY